LKESFAAINMRQGHMVSEEFQPRFYSKNIVNIREDFAAVNMRQDHMVPEDFEPRFYSKKIATTEEKLCSF
jgi:hypothetical protein